MGAREVQAFLTWLAVERDVAASTQNQALCALLVLYCEVLRLNLPRIGEAVRARRSRRVPAVLTRDEIRAVMARLEGIHALVAGLLYGGGLRLLEALRLRGKDADFERRALVVRQARVTRTAPPFVRHAPAGGRLRHPHHAGAARPHGRPHYHDLHPCAQPRRPRSTQPARLVIRTVGNIAKVRFNRGSGEFGQGSPGAWDEPGALGREDAINRTPPWHPLDDRPAEARPERTPAGDRTP